MNRYETIRQFLQGHLPAIGDGRSIADDDDIFRLGYVNSLFAMQILTFVESTFGIVVENEEMDVSNFNSINHILAFIDRKTA